MTRGDPNTHIHFNSNPVTLDSSAKEQNWWFWTTDNGTTNWDLAYNDRPSPIDGVVYSLSDSNQPGAKQYYPTKTIVYIAGRDATFSS